MASFLQYFKKGEKNEVISEKDLLTKRREADIKMSKLKEDLNYYSNLLNKEKIIKINKEIKKKKRGKKKKNKHLSESKGLKTKRNIDNMKKRIASSKTRLNKSSSNLKIIKKSDNIDSLMNLPKIDILKRKNPMIKSFGYFKFNDEKIFNSKENKKENLILNKVEMNNFMFRRQSSKEPNKIKLKKKSSNEKPKIIINEVLNDISSMNGGHTHNFTSKFLKESSKKSNNALNGLVSYDTNISINVNIRKENKSISASVNNKNQNQTQNFRRNIVYLKEEKKNEKLDLEKDHINNSVKYLENDINNRRYSNNDVLKSKTNLYFNLRNKRKEELEKRFMIIRKNYKEKDINNNNKNQRVEIIKTYHYLIIPGNASYLIKNCMQHRVNWKESFNAITSVFNFKWQQSSFGIDYNDLGIDLNLKQLVNHYENHYCISNKANMFINLMEYCEKRKISVFKYVPFTIIFQFKDKINLENCNEIIKKESQKIEELKQFLNNYRNYIVNYDKIGKFYEDEKYQKDQIKRYVQEINAKKKLNKKKRDKEKHKIDNNKNINKDFKTEIILYHDYFKNMKAIEKIKKITKDSDGSCIPIEEKQKENIGKNTLIEIPETHASGNNLWIIKAINLNRGMCIKVVNSFEEMEKTLKKFKEGVKYNFSSENDENKSENKLKNNFFKNIVNTDMEVTEENEKNVDKNDKMYYCNRIIIQKYIEKPLLYKKRKCDIRIWVLLTQLMKVYVFKEGHLKTCSVEYDLNSNNPYTHITNYSFQKHNNNFQKFEKGNEVPFYDFQKFIDEKYPEKNYKLNIDLMDKIKEIVYLTMRSVKSKINKNNRNHQFEIFGYDFMLDENFNLFLIEINTNPGLEESSPWIKIIIPRMLDDALRLTLDQLFETKYDFNLNYKKSSDLEDILDDTINQNQNIKKEDNNDDNKRNIKYKSPFPVPGYEVDENLWDFVCDLNEIDPLDELITDNNKTFDEVKHLLKLNNRVE